MHSLPAAASSACGLAEVFDARRRPARPRDRNPARRARGRVVPKRARPRPPRPACTGCGPHGPLSYVRGQGYFGPAAKHRLIVLLTDGESAPYDPAATAAALTQPSNASPFSGIQTQTDAPISLVIVRLGAPSDHVYAPNGTIDAAYRAEPHAAAIVSTLAAQARGGA